MASAPVSLEAIAAYKLESRGLVKLPEQMHAPLRTDTSFDLIEQIMALTPEQITKHTHKFMAALMRDWTEASEAAVERMVSAYAPNGA